MKNCPHPENSGRQPRARSDGKTVGVQTPIGRLEMINETKMLLIYFFLLGHESETTRVEKQKIVLKSQQYLFSLELLNKYTSCRSRIGLFEIVTRLFSAHMEWHIRDSNSFVSSLVEWHNFENLLK